MSRKAGSLGYPLHTQNRPMASGLLSARNRMRTNRSGHALEMSQIESRHKLSARQDLAILLDRGDPHVSESSGQAIELGAGISRRSLLVPVVWPLFTTLEISSEEMKSRMKKHLPVTVSNQRAEIRV